jgi:hypothetical protein
LGALCEPGRVIGRIVRMALGTWWVNHELIYHFKSARLRATLNELHANRRQRWWRWAIESQAFFSCAKSRFDTHLSY